MNVELSHISIVVPDLDEAAARLKKVYGLAIGPVQINAEQGVRMAYVTLPNAQIELMEPLRPDASVAKFLERNPAGGIHHFSLAVEDIVKTAGRLRDHGVQVLGDEKTQRNVHGERIAFIHPKDFLGALVELEERTETVVLKPKAKKAVRKTVKKTK
ncbi:MAG: methylmalonyl-CoA epimerase [Burkholderiales bacterium]